MSEKCFFALWLPRNVLKIIWMEGIFCCKIPKRNESTKSKLKLLYRAVGSKFREIHFPEFVFINVFVKVWISVNLMAHGVMSHNRFSYIFSGGQNVMFCYNADRFEKCNKISWLYACRIFKIRIPVLFVSTKVQEILNFRFLKNCSWLIVATIIFKFYIT